jgi:hypothetical protein
MITTKGMVQRFDRILKSLINCELLRPAGTLAIAILRAAKETLYA